MLPGLNDLVALRLEDGDASLPSRVEDVIDGHLVVAAPSVTGDLVTEPVGRRLDVEWSSPRGLLVVPARVTGFHRANLRLWQLEVLGEPVTLQRRRFARAHVALPGWLYAAAEAGEPVRPGTPGALAVEITLTDLSEGGMGLSMHRTRVVEAGAAVTLRMHLLDEDVVLPGRVLRVLPMVPPGGGAVRVVVILDDPGTDAPLLRRAVLKAQIDARRTRA